jgi:hypothetical protein
MYPGGGSLKRQCFLLDPEITLGQNPFEEGMVVLDICPSTGVFRAHTDPFEEVMLILSPLHD